MKTTINRSLAVAGLCLALPQTSQALEFGGYLRSGIGNATKGGSQSCFQLPGAQTKYRLGNECEQYGELELRQDLYTLDDGSVFQRHDGMVSLYNRYNHSLTFNEDNGSVRLPQPCTVVEHARAQWRSLWAGRRYYKRNDIHISISTTGTRALPAGSRTC